MNIHSRRSFLLTVSGFLVALKLLSPAPASAQWPIPPPTTPDAQRNALVQLRSQVGWLQNATRTAANYGEAGYGNVWGQFQVVRAAYQALKDTLNPRQLMDGANALAELDAGLDILQEAFSAYQADVAAGRPARTALRDMCQVLREGSQLWLQELNRTCSQLRGR